MWTLFDYIIAATLLFGAYFTYRLISKRGSPKYRVAVGLAIFASIALIWINGAVGIIGNEDNPANLLYFGVIIAGIVGVAISRFETKNLARTAFVMGIIQFLVPIIALLIWRPDFSAGIIAVFILNGLFVALFVVSGVLLQRSS